MPENGGVRALIREPFTSRARREFLFCLAGSLAGVAGFFLTVALILPALVVSASVLGTVVGLMLVVLSLRAARRIGALHRWLAARILRQPVPAPPSFRKGQGILGRLDARLRDGVGWRAISYSLIKLPIALAQAYAGSFWLIGLADLSYPFWWPLFRNHPPGTALHPVAVLTPIPFGEFRISGWPDTFLASFVGALLLLGAPWVTRAVVAADRWLIRSLLGPGRLTERVRQLEETRAIAVDDSAALLRQVERDLHDGAQMRLAAVALNLGMAREKLAANGEQADIEQLSDLVNAAHQGAKDALVELRVLAKGIHPPVLDNGLADALATLAAGSAIPVELHASIPDRPTPAIESIAYFCAAELLANATKHSFANKIKIKIETVRPGVPGVAPGMADSERGRVLRMSFADDGVGGADPGRGSGLSGLVQRVAVVDGRLDVDSPPGGPTEITVDLPLRA
jgi:signal transduction histidine kinase